MTRRRLGVVQVLLLLCPAPAIAQTGTLSGRITQAVGGAPVSGAAIVLEGTGRGTLSDSLGTFAIADLPPRAYRVQVRRQGYRQVERMIQVRAGDTTAIGVALEASTQLLDLVRTEARAPDHDLFLTRPALGTTSLTARSVSAVPRLGEPDIIRIIPLLPGVAARNDFSSGYNVHGGEADQNLILIDGYPIYNPFHLGGLFSTFMESTVRDVTLMTGGFPARYGGRLSSVLDVTSAIEGRPGVHGSVEVSLLGSTATMASPLGTRGSWLVAGRRTYADWLIDAFSSEVLPYHFYDLHGHATYRLPGEWRWSATAYGGRDVLDADLSETDVDSTTSGPSEGTLFFRWGNAIAGTTLSKTFSRALGGDSTVVAQRVSQSKFNTKLDAGEGSATVHHDIVDRRLAGDVTLYTTAHQLTAGYEVSNYSLRTEDGSPALGVQGTNRRQQARALAFFANELWKPSLTSRWLVEGGLRVENLASTEGAVFSPRLSIKRFLRDDLAVSLATGRFTQWTQTLSQEDRPIRFFDLYALSDSATPLASAWHYLAGVEHWLGSTRQVRVNAFFKRYDRIMEFRLGQDPFTDGDEFDTATGTSYGVDVMLRQFDGPGSRTSGWITYNYAVARRELDGRRFAPAHDRRHNVNLVSNHRLGKYTVGARLGIASGTPYTEIVSQYVRRRIDPFTGRWENPGRPPNEVDYLGGPRSGARYPLTQRLDVSVSRLFQRGRATIRPYLSVINAYNARNVLDYQLDYGVVPPVRRTFSQFPFLPSLGVNVAF